MSMGFSGDNDYSSKYRDLLGKTQQLERELAESKKLITKLDTDVADLHLIRSNLEDELALANDLGLLNEKLFNREIEDAKYDSDQLMLVIEGQDANYERMKKELAEAQVIIERQKKKYFEVQEVIKVLIHHNDTLLKTNTYLRSCPRPPQPDYNALELEDLSFEQWEDDVKHYETHLTSNPPEEFK